MNQIKLIMGTMSLLLVAVVVSCTRNLSVPVTAIINTSTPTLTATPLITSTPTNTFTPTFTPTFTFTFTFTFTNTFTNVPGTPTNTATNTNTGTPTNTFTVTNTPTITDTPTITPTPTNTYTPTNTFTPTFTPTPTNTVAGPTATPTDTPTTNNDWDDFDSAPWAQPLPTYLYGPSPGGMAYEQNCTDVIKYNTTNGHNSSAGAIEDDITYTASGPLEEICFYNGASYGANENEQFTGVNPSFMSVWIYTDNPVVINKEYVYQAGNVNITAAPLPATAAGGTWTNIICPCPATPAFTAVAYAMFDIIPPASVTTFPYTANVIIDDIYFYQ